MADIAKLADDLASAVLEWVAREVDERMDVDNELRAQATRLQSGMATGKSRHNFALKVLEYVGTDPHDDFVKMRKLATKIVTQQ